MTEQARENYTSKSLPSAGTRKILTNKQLLFSFEGRITRKTYWYTILSFGLVSVIVANALAFVCLLMSHAMDSIRSPEVHMALYALVIAPFVITVSFASLAIQAKRWHDINKSGWCSIIAVIPVVGILWCIKVLGFTPSDSASNDYGPPQKDPGADEFVTPTIKELLLSWHGRVNRSTYWITFVVTAVFSWFVDFAWVYTTVSGAFVDGVLLLCLWPVILMVIKRLHDLGMSGWHALWVFVPYVCLMFVLPYLAGVFFSRYYDLLYYMPYLGFIPFFVIGFSTGNDGENTYGLPQKPF